MSTVDENKLPTGLTIEKEARNLAALATTDSLAAMKKVVLAQWRHNKTFAELAKHGIRPIDRLLFSGPPGNGKTMAAQWLAQQIGCPLYRIRAESLIEAWLGATSTNVSNVMRWLQKQGPCVALFDEVETMFPSRETATSNCDRALQAAAAVFWQYLDRWESPTLFVLATNMPERLDPALLSRIDLKIFFGPPTQEQTRNVAGYWAEVLHKYGGAEWGPHIAEGKWESFRALFHAVQMSVREFVVAGGAGRE